MINWNSKHHIRILTEQGYRQIAAHFDSAESAKRFAKSMKDADNLTVQIVEEVITTTYRVIDEFLVPATPMPIEDIIKDIIEHTEGHLYRQVNQHYLNLSAEDQAKVNDAVDAVLTQCDACGCHYPHEDLESFRQELYCNSCISELDEDYCEDDDS